MTTTAMNQSFPMTSAYVARKTFDALPPAPVRARVFDGAAMSLLPRISSAMGFHFNAGSTAAIRRDAAFVVTTVLGDDGLLPPSDIAFYGQKYDDATTWVVAYRGGLPVGALAIMDPRKASLGLDLTRRTSPSDLRMERTRELGRLAVLRHHEGSPLILVGLLVEAIGWALDHDVNHLFACANSRFEGLLRALCPSVRTMESSVDRFENPTRDRYLRKIRESLGAVQLLAFDVARTSPWRLLTQLFMGRLHRFSRPDRMSARTHLQLVRG